MSTDAFFALWERSQALLPWTPALILLPPLLLAGLLVWPRVAAGVGVLAPWAALPALLAGLAAPATELELPGLLLGSSLMLDPIGKSLLVILALLWLAAGWLAGERIRERGRLLLFLLAMTGSLALTVAGDLVVFLLASTVVGYTLYGLTARQHGAPILIGLLVLSDLVLFELLLLLVKEGAGLSLSAELPARAINDSALLLALAVLGFGAKAALPGLHYWLPRLSSSAAEWIGPLLISFVLGAGLLPWLRLLGPDARTGAPLPDIAGWLVLAGIGLTALLGLLQRTRSGCLGYTIAALSGFTLLLLTRSEPTAMTEGAVTGAMTSAALASGQSALALAALSALPRRPFSPKTVFLVALNGLAVLLLAHALLAFGMALELDLEASTALGLSSYALVGLLLGRLLWHPIPADKLCQGWRAVAAPEPEAKPWVMLFLTLGTAVWALMGTVTMSPAVDPMLALTLIAAMAAGLLLTPLLKHAPQLPPGDLALVLGRWPKTLADLIGLRLARLGASWRDSRRSEARRSSPYSAIVSMIPRSETQLRRWSLALILLLSLMLLLGLLGGHEGH
ncbi:hypothetical protein [Halochromatium glycolicum]|uniref:NADH:quinone oxidoreductase/Mrp antiporter membrane subunit domain-containing protein n=1 Tax=Halochromatium glycolicum TaxID=85075 RepID=A0AAJ0U0B8_9GAMM|nr:hypothetical protein [Halochromatium glycolicum]MBK1703063.1 hypothetical protein [Halochromatium glycolicum]